VALLAVVFATATPAAAFAGTADAHAATEPTELIVRVERGLGRGAVADLLALHGMRVDRTLPFEGMAVVRVPPGVSAKAAARALRSEGEVDSVAPNHVRTASARIPNDPLFPLLWGLSSGNDRDIDAVEAWTLTTGSAGVTVAVVDTGVAYDHPDLRSNMWTNQREAPNGLDDDGNGFVDDVHGWDFAADDPVPLDEHGHGTAVAGTIGARGGDGRGTVGVAWSVKLMPLRTGDASGTMTDEDIIRGFRYAAANGARVVNGSFGGAGFSAPLRDAIAAHPDVLFVFSAGNGGADGHGDDLRVVPEYPCSFSLPNVVCVTAAVEGSDSLAPFANFDPVGVHVAAPGAGIVSTFPGGAHMRGDGTSVAAAHVAGVAALLLARAPSLSAADLRRILLESVDVVPALAGKVATAGRVNAFAAVRSLGGAPVAIRAPDTRITKGPAGRVRSRRARFRFAASKRRSAFECRLDRGRWRTCSSPRLVGALAPGRHTFRVRARARDGGVDRTPAVRRWRVV
jgi:subtilisin family serine protease